MEKMLESIFEPNEVNAVQEDNKIDYDNSFCCIHGCDE